jgi:hypothetical protein
MCINFTLASMRYMQDGWSGCDYWQKRVSSLPPHPNQLQGPSHFLHNTQTSYKGHHISYTEYQRIYLLVSSGWSVKFTADLHLVPKFRMCGASPPHPILSSWHPCTKQKLLTIIEEVLYKTLCNSQEHSLKF